MPYGRGFAVPRSLDYLPLTRPRLPSAGCRRYMVPTCAECGRETASELTQHLFPHSGYRLRCAKQTSAYRNHVSVSPRFLKPHLIYFNRIDGVGFTLSVEKIATVGIPPVTFKRCGYPWAGRWAKRLLFSRFRCLTLTQRGDQLKSHTKKRQPKKVILFFLRQQFSL